MVPKSTRTELLVSLIQALLRAFHTRVLGTPLDLVLWRVLAPSRRRLCVLCEKGNNPCVFGCEGVGFRLGSPHLGASVSYLSADDFDTTYGGFHSHTSDS